MMDGTIKPEDVKIRGIESEEEKERKEYEKLQRKIKRDKEKEELRIKLKIQEREKWWDGAELFAEKKGNDDEEEVDADGNTMVSEQELIRQRYTANYARWDEWVPQDPASLSEAQDLVDAQDKVRNAEFEKNNAEFCNQYIGDMKEREKSLESKKEEANSSRLKGNKFFKRKEYPVALEHYMDSLKLQPYEVKTLTNIAQVYIQTKEYDDALEFLSRSIRLDHFHIKALSRSAFILSQQNKPSEALPLISRALKKEPTNTELINQHKEIEIIVRELQEEADLKQQVTKIAENPIVEPKTLEKSEMDNIFKGVAEGTIDPTSIRMKGVETDEQLEQTFKSMMDGTLKMEDIVMETVETEEEKNLKHGFILIDWLNKQFLSKNSEALKVKTSNKTKIEKVVKFEDMIVSNSPNSKKENDIVNTIVECTSLLKSNKQLRVYLRSSETLANAIHYITNFHGLFIETYDSDTDQLEYVSNLLLFVSSSLDGERSSKMLVVDHKLIQLVKTMLNNNVKYLNLIYSSMSIIQACCNDTDCTKSRGLIVGDKALFRRIGVILGELAQSQMNVKETKEEEKNPTDISKSVSRTSMNASTLVLCGKIIREVSFDEIGKSIITNEAGPIVCAVGFALSLSMKKKSKKTSELTEILLEALLGLSQNEPLRVFFSIELPEEKSSYENKSLIVNSTVNVIIKLMKLKPSLKSISLAVLMNSSLDKEVKQSFYDCNGLDELLSTLKMTDNERLKCDKLILARSAGLLSRLVSIPAVLEKLQQPDNYRLMVRGLKRLYMGKELTQSNDILLSKEEKDEQGHLIRTIASLENISPLLISIGMEEYYLESILYAFPHPRLELTKITPKSVILTPANPASTLLLGNAARCLMPYADVSNVADILYNSKELVSIEKLICGMSTCSDIRVRKNISILLAKGCRIPAAKEKITLLRGMQMMVELQSKLV
jgi:tetratricopeptide (TPR) repeat protein